MIKAALASKTDAEFEMNIQKVIEENYLILTEAAVIEKLRRSDGIRLHPRLENATLIYDVDGKRALRDIYKGFIKHHRPGVK